jgi:flavorubredoxin
MASINLFDTGNHKNLLLEDFSGGLAVQANQHLIIHGANAMLLDPGGHKVYNRVLSETLSLLGPHAKLRYLFLSHQDPDIVAAVNGWLMTTDADRLRVEALGALHPALRSRSAGERPARPIPDEGMYLDARGCRAEAAAGALPPLARATSRSTTRAPRSSTRATSAPRIGRDYREVTDFDAHLSAYMEGFHRRYMASNRAMAAWGAWSRGASTSRPSRRSTARSSRASPMVERFIAWCEALPCGVDLIDDLYPTAAG